MAYADYRQWLGLDSTSLSDDTLGKMIVEAQKAVIDDGVDSSSDYYDRLVNYKLGSLLVVLFSSSDLSGLGGPGGSLSSEKVGDVSVSYNGRSKSLDDYSGGGYDKAYEKLLCHAYAEAEDDLEFVCQ